MNKKEVTVKVEIENIDKLENLSKKLNEQVSEVCDTIREIRMFEMGLKLNQ